jgi:hypothetical protein
VVLRRRTRPDTAPDDTTVKVVEKVGGKGRPTPKRREAETERRAQVKPPRDRKEAYRLARERAKVDRAKQRAGLMTGDEKALPLRDRGKVRAYVRNHVDARRSAAEFFLPFAVVVLLVSFVNSPFIRGLSVYAWMVMLVWIIVDSFAMSRSLKRELATRFPDEDAKGAVGYGVMRSLQMRRLRLPPPRVKRGDRV